MTVLARLTATEEFGTSTAAISRTAQLRILDSPPGHAELTVNFDGSAAIMQPSLQLDDGSGGTLAGVDVDAPAIVPSWTVDGSDPGAVRVGDLEIAADLESCSRSWKVAIAASTGGRRTGDHAANPLGYEFDVGGPPPGRQVPVGFAVDMIGRGSQAGTEATLQLLTDGYVVTSDRSWSKDSHVMELDGEGPEFLYRDVEVDLVLAAGHSNTQGQLVNLVMDAAGVPSELQGVDPGLGSPRNVAVEERCVPAWQLIHEILRPIGYVVMASREDGVFREVSIDWDDDAVLELNHLDLDVEAGLSTEADNSVPSCVWAVGHRLDDAQPSSGSGVVTAEVVIETYEDDWTLPFSVASQAAGSSTIIPTGNVAAPRSNVLTRLSTLRVTTENGCTVQEYVREEGYMAPAATRYIADETTDGETRIYPTHNVHFYDTVPLADDGEEGFLWEFHRWRILEETWTYPQWSATGRRTGTITNRGSWLNPEASIKNRANASAPWEDEPFVGGRNMQADFATGRVFTDEKYFAGDRAPDDSFPLGRKPTYPGRVVSRFTQVDVQENDIDECDYVTGETTTVTAYGKRPGSTRLYGDGLTFTSATIEGLDTVNTTLRTVINNRPVTIVGGETPEGTRIPTQVTTGDSGGIPGAEICTDDTVDRDREETFRVKVCFSQDDVEDERKAVEYESIWVETQEEAEAWGRRELAILMAYRVTLTLAWPIPIIEAGNTITVDASELGFTSTRKLKVWEPELTIEGGSGGRVVHELGCLVSPFDGS